MNTCETQQFIERIYASRQRVEAARLVRINDDLCRRVRRSRVTRGRVGTARAIARRVFDLEGATP